MTIVTGELAAESTTQTQTQPPRPVLSHGGQSQSTGAMLSSLKTGTAPPNTMRSNWLLTQVDETFQQAMAAFPKHEVSMNPHVLRCTAMICARLHLAQVVHHLDKPVPLPLSLSGMTPKVCRPENQSRMVKATCPEQKAGLIKDPEHGRPRARGLMGSVHCNSVSSMQLFGSTQNVVRRTASAYRCGL